MHRDAFRDAPRKIFNLEKIQQETLIFEANACKTLIPMLVLLDKHVRTSCNPQKHMSLYYKPKKHTNPNGEIMCTTRTSNFHTI